MNSYVIIKKLWQSKRNSIDCFRQRSAHRVIRDALNYLVYMIPSIALHEWLIVQIRRLHVTRIFNNHGNQRKRVCFDCNFCLFTKRNKIFQKIKWFVLIEKDCLLAIRSKGLHFCMSWGSDQIVQIIFGLRLHL